MPLTTSPSVQTRPAGLLKKIRSWFLSFFSRMTGKASQTDGRSSEAFPSYTVEAPERVIDFPVAEVKRLAGLTLSLAEIRRVLDRLGFMVAGQGERLKVAVPSWRPDVSGKADVVEEVVRILGECQGNVGKAAKMLGIHRSTLYRRLEKLGIQVNQ